MENNETPPVEETPVEGESTIEEDASKNVEEIKTLKEEKTNLISEIQSIRKDRAETREEIEVLKKKLEDKVETPADATPTNDEIITETVKKILLEGDKDKAKSNKDEALKRFIAENKQFNEDNDPTGLKRDALEKKLARFNTEGLSTLEEFYSVIGDAHSLLGGNDTKPKTDEVANPYSTTPAIDVTPVVVTNSELSTKERETAKRLGWTEEKMLKIKTDKPDYFARLFREV